MSDLRKLAHLQEQLGSGRFEALISSDNTGKVKEFCDGLLRDMMPTEMTICGRTYEILSFLEGNERDVAGHTMVRRSHKMGAHLGENDGYYLLDHQVGIPTILRGKVFFVFTDWRHPDYPECVYCIDWRERSQCWFKGYISLVSGRWGNNARLLRRK